MNDQIYTVSQYIESCTSIVERINRYDSMIDAMELKLLESIDGSNIQEYQMDDGQMKVRTSYRSTEEMEKGILALEKAKQRLVNKYNGRTNVFRSGNF